MATQHGHLRFPLGFAQSSLRLQKMGKPLVGFGRDAGRLPSALGSVFGVRGMQATQLDEDQESRAVRVEGC